MSEHHDSRFHERLDAAMPPAVADNRILLCEIGSTAHGCGDGHDDLDTMGLFIEPIELVVGTSRRAHWVASTGDDQTTNTADDLDVTYYSLRKFAKLALAGNPTITNLFFAPVLESTEAGERLREHASLFLSRRAAPRYVGYMRAQLERLEGTRGQKRVKRPELEARYGFDTKYAYHVVRLGLQGRELLTTGHVSMPMSEQHRELLIAIRTGKFSKDEALELAASVEAELLASVDESVLPDEPDLAAVDEFLVDIHRQHWELRAGAHSAC